MSKHVKQCGSEALNQYDISYVNRLMRLSGQPASIYYQYWQTFGA